MAANVFQLPNTSTSFNQGVYGKTQNLRRIRAVIQTPLDYYLTPANLASSATLKTKFQADAKAADPDDRIHILSLFGEAKDDSKAPQNLSFGYGLDVQLYGAQYKFTLVPQTQDLFRFQKMQAFNGKGEEFLQFLVDENYQIAGTKGLDGNGNVVMRGFTLQDFQAGNVKLDMGEGAKQEVYISYADSSELNQGNLMIWPAGFNVWTQVENVRDVTLNALSALTSGVVSIAPIVGGGVIGTNLAEKYPTVLADVTLWVAKKVSNGATLTISSIAHAIVSGVDTFTFTFSTSSPYPTSGNTLSLELTTPTALATAGIIPAEVPDPLILTV